MSEKGTPRANGFSMPAEWYPHIGVWSAWPSHRELWQDNLEAAQADFVGLCRAIALDGGEALNILVPTAQAESEARLRLKGLPLTLHQIPFGDIWLRDTAPLFLNSEHGQATVRFDFNSWGGKYNLPHDDRVGERIARAAAEPEFHMPFVLEGGSVEVDGEGTCLTTRQCLLNTNRNPKLKQEELEQLLKDSLGVTKVLWLSDGLINDHTDGHIDTIARFVAPGEVLCMAPADASDPNSDVLRTLQRDLESMTDAKGRRLKVSTVPSPGAVYDQDGLLMPASYLNFYIANKAVIVPTYGAKNDAQAVASIAKHFPLRKTLGCPAKAILCGGGAFHCITQQQPTKGV